ncbi:Fungalysin/Thermolysin Extracellular metalloproteinase 5 [Puccinia graminis f. sp. tritici]|uniref:Fungalysin/Thermolysin Extracellular metalloproteinase 5 n=1 Tax=Puccinia graminis f. sp. tritici TaxID=56615 RepID=A0A5B0Q792_PUCGR|nr:Fungalysin/Thermolysin Extracellular metalloproteinase 5 [Puccinia graminis f. sp. tritici]KAA1133178.1 Fungalysin/Thermolysin Extracellular metalloproteinase 5 [Puccinia graminis f. sp. tritici]
MQSSRKQSKNRFTSESLSETENHLRSRSLEDLIQSIDIITKTPSSSFRATSHLGEEGPPTFELFNVPGCTRP